jgi:DNA-binding transcriptional regulator YhcF (GntR family)
MKIWLSKNSEIPVRQQLATQIVLGIASGDLTTGERLPSTREIARRFGVHSNTVSNAYKLLAAEGWLEFRQGSGFYVSDAKPETPENSLDKLIAEFFQKAREQGFSIAEIRRNLSRFFESEPSEKFLVIESDADFRDILIEEIRQATGFAAEGVSFEDFRANFRDENSIFGAMFDETAKIKSVVSDRKKCVFLKARSAAEAMKDKPRPDGEDLIAVVSGWEKFLLMAKTMLLAANLDAESLIIRSTKQKEWKNGLNSAAMIICDSLCALHFPNDERIRRFQLISDESLSELRNIKDSR